MNGGKYSKTSFSIFITLCVDLSNREMDFATRWNTERGAHVQHVTGERYLIINDETGRLWPMSLTRQNTGL